MVNAKGEHGKWQVLENPPSAFSNGSSFSLILNIILSCVSTALFKQIALGSRHPLSQSLFGVLQRK